MDLAEIEKDNIRNKAASIKSGIAVKKDSGGVKRKGTAQPDGAKKRGRGANMPDDEDVETGGKKSPLDVPYMLWGFSQKLQISGVRALASVLLFWKI